MSQSGLVFPGIDAVPTVGEVLRGAEREMAWFFPRLGIERELRLHAELGRFDDPRRMSDPEYVPVDPAARFWCADGEYIWISIDGVRGGTDASLDHDSDDDAGEPHHLANAPRSHAIPHLGRLTRMRYHWVLGQSGLIRPAFDLLAASLAKLTDGALYSYDGGWEHERLPMLPTEMLDRYRADRSLHDFIDVAQTLEIPPTTLRHGVHRYEYGKAEPFVAACARGGWRVYRLPQGLASAEAFFAAAAERLPLDPSAARAPDELRDALLRGLRQLPDDRIAIVWQGALHLELEAFGAWEMAMRVLDDVVCALADDEAPKRLLVLVVPREHPR